MRGFRTRTCLAALATCLAAALLAPAANASFHLVRIRAIHAGGGSGDYVQLQETAAAENLVAGQTLTSYDNSGNPLSPSFTFPTNFANSANQATILVADTAIVNGVAADFVYPGLQVATGMNGGFLCYSGFDCVAWGMPGAGVTLSSPYGTPAVASTGISPGQTLVRSIAQGCSTLFETSDDTNNSAADFSLGQWTPRDGNSTIVEKPCTGGGQGAPNTKIKKRPKNRSTDDSPTFKFKSTEAGSTFKCKLDHKKFHKCKSPKTYHGLDAGKHSFKVEAIDADGNVDKSPAKDKFKILP
jgi:hypothetical protein